MVTAMQTPVTQGVRSQQVAVRPGQQVVSPQQIVATPAQDNGFDISTLLTSIMPLIMLVMVMQMMKPLMGGMTAS